MRPNYISQAASDTWKQPRDPLLNCFSTYASETLARRNYRDARVQRSGSRVGWSELERVGAVLGAGLWA